VQTDALSTASMPLIAVVDGSCTLGREDIGAKAWGVNRMRALGLPVPPAIVITTQACRAYYALGQTLDEGMWVQLVAHISTLEEASGRRFGAVPRPLLVSVRSGAAHSMPGMMDTILNLGINDTIEAALSAEHRNPRYAADLHRRLVEQYRNVVLGGRAEPVPDDPWLQLRTAVAAVFDSWRSPRAVLYRRDRGFSDVEGTAVMIQAMVFGNADAHSGTGVLFSRNPITGDPPPWGEWLAGGQGEDVVSGRRTPGPLEALAVQMPEVHAELLRAATVLEADAGDIQDIEFTVESGRLWLLQMRTAKRSPQAAIRAAVAFAEEGLISKEQAVRRLSAEQVRQLPRLQLAPAAADHRPVAIGHPACPGVASGVVVIDPEEAEQRSRLGEDVILARPNTNPEDLQGIIAARGVMTEQGGSTSHAAVICRELGRPCVVGCGSHSVTPLVGRQVTLDGSSGRVWIGQLSIDQSDEAASEDVRKLLEWGAPLIPLRLLDAHDRSRKAIDATAALGAKMMRSAGSTTNPATATNANTTRDPTTTPETIVDLDLYGDDWRSALRPGIVVRGHVLDTDAGIRAALEARVAAAVVSHRLPALLGCLQAVPQRGAAEPSHDGATAAQIKISELALLRLLGLKGRATSALLADVLAVSVDVAEALYEPLRERGLCHQIGTQFQLTPAGRDRVAHLLAEERAQVDPAAVIALYEDFCVVNAEVKQILTAWQVKRDGAPNDHADRGYDDGVLQRLAQLHARAAPLMRRLVLISPRLHGYTQRLGRAMGRIAAGDRGYVAKILTDSYHAVWFELHEELIALTGLTREAVARGTRGG